jgi:hypothetical protein
MAKPLLKLKVRIPEYQRPRTAWRRRIHRAVAEALQGTRIRYEEAIWQLARFYSMTGRLGDSTAGVARLLAGTPDPEKHAAGCLALGQLLEQQRRIGPVGNA